MADLFEKIGKAPKWALISGAAVLLGLVGFGFYWLAFGMNKPKEEAPETVLLDMPDAEEDSYSTTAMEEFGRTKYGVRKSTVDDYWDSLGDEDDAAQEADRHTIVDDLDPNIYSDYERDQIRSGTKTKAQIDQEHAEALARREELARTYAQAGGSGYSARKGSALTQAQQDSIYTARLEQAYKIAAKYTQQQPVNEGAQGDAAPDEEEEEQERRLDLDSPAPQSSSLPMDSFTEDGIISSLDSPSSGSGGDVVHYGSKPKPVKATFLKNEKLISGNRVIMRLMQDMMLADGTVIPANTHITGTCSIGRRMKINVTVLHYAGRMFPVDISVYDNDGTEGIYCPLVEEANSTKKKAKKVAENVVQSAGSIAGTILTGNPFIGSMATSGIRSATSSIGADGTVAVDVSAGYEFYVYENIKTEPNKK